MNNLKKLGLTALAGSLVTSDCLRRCIRCIWFSEDDLQVTR